ncbi:LysE family translocator [Pseudomonas sp.]|uniref:LysE family translocator n=1 Tax=Pseudomonas sp. TaxID=306 RepID=UPI003C71EB01
MDIINFPFFAAAVIALHATPGPDTAYVVGRTLAHGRGAGLISALGITAGCLVHTLASTLGFSALIAAVPAAFDAVRILGALYLAYQGVRLILSKPSVSAEGGGLHASLSYRRLFTQAFLTNVLNPKVILFYLAFFPQFVDPEGVHKPAAYLVLGIYFAVTAGIWASGVVWFAGALGRKLKTSQAKALLLNRAIGALFVGLGAKLLASS